MKGLKFFKYVGFVLALGGCKPSNDSSSSVTLGEPKSSLKIGVVYDYIGRKDRSFNDIISKGVERAEKELGIQAIQIDSRKIDDYEANITALIDKDMDLIIGSGITMKSTLEKAAKEHPDKKFVYINNPIDVPNVYSIVFKEHEGSFLAGYAAALASKTKKVGFVGGQELPIIEKFRCGYEAGVRAASNGIEILPPKFLGTFDNIDTGKAAADCLYNEGADVVYQAASKAGLGVLRSAEAHKKLAIGVDEDQDDLFKGYVLTSMRKRCDEVVFNVIESLKNGTYVPGVHEFGVKEGGVSLTDMLYTKHILGESNLKKLAEIEKKVSKGEFKIPSTPEELKEFKC